MSRAKNRYPLLLVLACTLRAGAQDPMTLDACIRHANEHSREIQQLRIALETGELSTRILRGKFRPTLKLSGDRTVDEDDLSGAATIRQELPAGITASATGRASDAALSEDESADLSLTVSKVLIGGGSWAESMLEIDNSLLGELINANRLHRYERELFYRVKQVFYRLIRNQQTLRINEMRLERAKTNLLHAIERERPLDIATARIEVPDNEAGVLRAKRQILSTEDDLKTLIGMDVRQNVSVDTRFAFAARTLETTRDVGFCLTNHEDIVNAQLTLKQRQNELPVQKAKRWPKLTLSARSGRDSVDGINLDGETDTSIGVEFSWEPGSFTERLKTKRLTRNIAADAIDIEDLKQGKIKGIRDLARRIKETRQLVDVQEQKIAVAEQRSELYADRWENGEIDILEYIRSQNDLENSRIELINQQTTYMELLAEYEFAVGR